MLKIASDTKVHPRYLSSALKHMQAVELTLLGASSFDELGRVLSNEYERVIGADCVSVLVRRRDEVDLCFSDTEGVNDWSIRSVDDEVIDGLAEANSQYPCLLDFDTATHAQFFPRLARPLNTVVVQPLSRKARIIGWLVFACDSGRHNLAMTRIPSLNRLAAVVAACVENLYNQELLRQLSLRDPLTGLYNRRYFTEHLSASLARGLRGGWPVCCVYLDVDHFKRVNDEHGHAAGDAVLCHLAKTLTTQLRSGEVVARYGGEEFCLLLADAKAQTGVAVAERIRASVAKTPIELPSGAWIDLTVSCGVADSCGLNAFEQRTGAQRLLQQADEALYQAKRNGRNRVVSSTVSSD